jgi:hypothetical protein
MAESWTTRLTRWGFNWFPAYRGTGGRITYIAADYREIHIRLPLNWRTRNYVGTIYGGSMYGAIDPIYMYMLIKSLGPDYIVWDKGAAIRFKKPGRCTLHATFRLDEREIESIRSELASEPSIDRLYTIELRDRDETVHATIEKTIYIRRMENGPP